MTENQNDKAQNKAVSTLDARATRNHVPLTGMFELTSRCNLQCKMCYVHMSAAEIAACNAKELTTRQWLQLAEQAAKAGTLYLTLTGGEPLFRDDFEELYTGLSMMGFRLGINTNASLITPKYERLFSKYPPAEILVTLYGADNEAYHRVCGNPAAFDNVIKGLEFAAGLSTRLGIRSTLIKQNKEQLKQLRDIAYRFKTNLDINPFVNMPVPGVSSDVESCRLSAGECVDIIEENNALIAGLYKNSEQAKAAAGSTFDGIEFDKPAQGSDVYPGIISCQASKSMYHIKWDGKMYPCISFLSPYTLPLEEGFKEAWNRLPDLLKALRRPKKCSGCEYSDRCTVCPAMVEAETGSFDKAPEYICAVVEEMAARNML